MTINCAVPANWADGLGVRTLVLVEHGQVVEAGGHIRVLQPQGLLLDRPDPLVERLGIG